MAQNISFNAVVVSDHVKGRFFRSGHFVGGGNGFDAARPFVIFGRGNSRYQVLPGHGGGATYLGKQCGEIVLAHGDDAAQGAALAQKADEFTGVDLCNDRYVIGGEKMFGAFLGAPVAGNGRDLADYQAFNEGLDGFVIGQIGAIVADLRIGEDNDLTAIGRIGENFLITGDGGIEDHLTGSFDRRTKTDSLEDRTVLQGENCLLQQIGS